MEKVKVLYNTLIKYRWTNGKNTERRDNPLFEIYELLDKINRLSKKRKFMDISGGKFMFLESVTHKTLENNNVLLLGLFKSARIQFRPNLINKLTGSERENPKLISEGDIEKTHFSILVDNCNNEVFLLVQYNFSGVTVVNIVEYLKKHNVQIFKKEDKKLNYVIRHNIIPKENFIEALKSLSSVKVAEVTFDKRLLGSSALSFSNRLVSVKNDLKLSIQSNPRESIKETAIDIFNNFNGGKSEISKVRIKGKDELDNDVLLDTSFMNKMEYINVEKNESTGEFISSQMYSGLTTLINSL